MVEHQLPKLVVRVRFSLDAPGGKNMSGCNHDCSSCSENCASRDKASFIINPSNASNIKKTIAVISGKGGVGKSSVTSLLAVQALNKGNKVAIIDADITGPSIPKCFNVHEMLEGDGQYIYPSESKRGVKIVSANLMLDNETDPIVWRGPMIASMVKQFYTDVAYGDVDYLFIDMPPGTGDVALTVFQSIKIDGLVLVTTPQDLVSMIVAKAIKMANMMEIPILGIVENMSYAICPHCNEPIHIFGESKLENVAKEYNLNILGKIPFDQKLAKACDEGNIENIEETYLDWSL